MYPFIRMAWQRFLYRKAPPLGIFDEHRSTHICMPWDLDIWKELNNGRTLTLYDMGRLPMAARMGLIEALRQRRWTMVVAGASVRYRRRIVMFDRITMRTRVIGWDDRFFYMEQSMWKQDGECANHVLLRGAFTGGKGMIPPAEVMQALGHDGTLPEMPDWVRPWIEAASQRPWPPMQD